MSSSINKEQLARWLPQLQGLRIRGDETASHSTQFPAAAPGETGGVAGGQLRAGRTGVCRARGPRPLPGGTGGSQPPASQGNPCLPPFPSGGSWSFAKMISGVGGSLVRLYPDCSRLAKRRLNCVVMPEAPHPWSRTPRVRARRGRWSGRS